MYGSWTELGQKRPGLQKPGFCTFATVDMQALFHSRAGFSGDFAVYTCRFCIETSVGRTLSRLLVAQLALPLSFCRPQNGRAVPAMPFIDHVMPRHCSVCVSRSSFSRCARHSVLPADRLLSRCRVGLAVSPFLRPVFHAQRLLCIS